MRSAAHVRIPLYLPGLIIKKINLARFTLTLSSLLQSSLPIIDSMKIAALVESNVIYRAALLEAAEGLKKGRTLSELLLEKPHLFPPMVTGMLSVGEESGQVEKMLKELADYYGNEVDITMKYTKVARDGRLSFLRAHATTSTISYSCDDGREHQRS
jgi:type IV pilus assembly protein PilC